jgi:TP901 family phage tail tape measure protein
MAITAAELQAVVSVNDKPLQEGMQRVNSSFAGMGASSVTASGVISGAIGGLVAGVIPALIGAVSQAVVGIYEIGTAFDDASDKIRISTGAVGAELKALEGSFKTIFTSLPVSANDASIAISFLASRLHISGEALEKLAATELELARITGSQLGPQLETTTRLFKDWGDSIGDPTEALDFLFKVSQKTAVGVTDLSTKLVQFGAPLRELGFSFEQAATLIGKFQAEGVELSKALPGLKLALAKMADDGATNAAQAFQMLIDKIQATKNPMEQLRLSTEAFGQRAGVDMVQAIRQGRFSIEELQRTIESSRETIIGAGKDTEDFAEKWVILRNKATENLAPLGGLVLDTLTAITSTFTDTSEQIEKRWAQLWNDLIHGTEEGTHGIITQILMAQDPASDAGAQLAESIRHGFLTVLAKLGADFRSFEQKFGQLKIKAEGPQVSRHDWTKILDLDGQKRVMDEILQITDTRFNTDMPRITGKGGKASAKAFRDPFVEEVKRAMGDVLQAIEDGLSGGDKIGRVLAAKITPAIDALKVKSAELATTVRAVGDAFINDMGRAIDTVTPKIIRGDGTFEALINRMIDFKRVSEQAARASKQEFDALSDTFRDLSSQLPTAWNTIIDGIVQGSGKVGTELLKFGSKIKGYAVDIINVFDTMPGKWGSALNKALSEVNKWISFLDSAIRLLQRMFGADQTGLGGILEGVAGLFKKTTTDISGNFDAMQKQAKAAAQGGGSSATGLANMWNKASNGMKVGVSAAASAFATLTAAMAVTGATGSKTAGFLTSLFGSTLAGIQAGLAFGPVGGAIVGGVSLIGGIIGMFMGKSSAQKAAEKAAADKAKIDMQQAAQNVIKSAIEGFDAAMSFFEKLDEFTQVRKSKFKAFFANFDRLMDYFLELSKKWAGDSLTKAKAAAEAIGPIADAIARLPEAFDAINSHFGVAQSAIDQFFTDFGRVMDGFFARIETWAVGKAKHARKIANNIAPAIDLMGPLLEAIKNMSSLSRPPDEAFDIIDDVIDTIVTRTAALAEKFDKAVLKVMANFAEKSGFALTLWTEAVSSIKDMVDIKMPSDQDFTNVFLGIEKIINGMTEMAERLSTESLGRAESIAQASMSIFASIKAGVEALTSLKDFTNVLPEVFTAFYNGFNAALDMLASMATRGLTFEQTAKTFESYIASGSASLAHAFTMLSQIMNAAGSFFPGGAVATTAVPALASGGDIQSSGLAFLHAGERVVPAAQVRHGSGAPVNLTVNINAGTVVHESQLPDLIVKALVQAERMGKVNKVIFGGASLQFAR